MCSERDSPLKSFVLPRSRPTWTRAAHLWRPPGPTCADPEAEASTGQFTRVWSGGHVLHGGATRSVVSDVSPGHAARPLKQAAQSLPGEPVSRGFAGRGALEGYPSHFTSLVTVGVWMLHSRMYLPLWWPGVGVQSIAQHISRDVASGGWSTSW